MTPYLLKCPHLTHSGTHATSAPMQRGGDMTTTIYDAERRDISIAVGGDAMITRRMRAFQEPRFLKLVEILRGADVSLVNLEMLFHDYESSWQWSSATYTRSDPPQPG